MAGYTDTLKSLLLNILDNKTSITYPHQSIKSRILPELPEVETTRRGIEPHIQGKKICRLSVFNPNLRWPVPLGLSSEVNDQMVVAVTRRAKYLVLQLDQMSLLIHLGMSGSLRIVDASTPRLKHDHVEIDFHDGTRLRFNDPRRFGCVLPLPPETDTPHPLLAGLGPEPLSADFDGLYMHRLSRGKKAPIKTFIMNQAIVVGVGNIYANEALFKAGIHPKRAAGQVSLKRYQTLADEIKSVLAAAITMGGTTLRDFVGGDGKPGYFQQTLRAYGRGGEPCTQCRTLLKEIRLGQRSTVFCPHCQR